MFDALLDLRRRRMMGVPQVTGNVIPPDVGPDIAVTPVPTPPPIVMQPPAQTQDDGPDFRALAELGGSRAMGLLMKRMKPEQGAALASLPVLSKLFRR